MRTPRTRPRRASRPSGMTWRPARDHGQSPVAEAGQDAAAELDADHAMTALYQLHYPSLVRLAALLVPDLATAEDIVQDAFAAVYGRWHMLPGSDAALACLRRSVVHRSRSAPLRRSGPEAGPSAAGIRRRVGAARSSSPPA